MIDFIIAYPKNDQEYAKGTPEYKDRLRSFMSPLQAGKILVFERPHRLINNYMVRRIVTKWKFHEGCEDLIGTKNEAIAVWDATCTVKQFDSLEEAETYIRECESSN
jgi:hypothetical protein